MRADRLISLLMLLQARGPLTARQLAQELEVCERTIYRDIEALSMAGIPVYGEPGPAGGFDLLETYRTNLTGLTENEVRALFMINISTPLDKLGIGGELRTALLKLSAALPDSRRDAEERVRSRFYIDSNWWQGADEPTPHLTAIHQAVWDDRKIILTYSPHFFATFERLVAPYGLVAKAGIWYLVAEREGKMEVRRVSDLHDARLTSERFQRKPGFNLEIFWKEWCSEQEDDFSLYPVDFRISPDAVPRLLKEFGSKAHRALDLAECDPNGWRLVELSFSSLEDARDKLLPFGSGVEVIRPEALRLSIQDVAVQVARCYKAM